MNNVWLGRAGLILIALAAAISGAVTLSQIRQVGIIFTEHEGRTIIADFEKSYPNPSGNLHKGDILLKVGSVEIENHLQANRLTNGLFDSSPLPLFVSRTGQSLTVLCYPYKSNSLHFIFLNTLLGLLFILVGVLVGWGENRNHTGRAYFRLTVVSGISILLSSYDNPWSNTILHYLHATVRLVSISLIAPSLVDFLLGFSGWELKRRIRQWLYAPGIVIALLLVATYFWSEIDPNANNMRLFLWSFNTLLGTLLVAYFLFSFIVVVQRYRQNKNTGLRDQNRWLLIVTLVGLFPYFLFYRLPPAFDLEPLLPRWVVLSLMLIVPTGWGMAVASFRMLNVEWALSRTMIYSIAILFSAFFLLTISLIVGLPFGAITAFSLKTQVLAAILFIVVSSSGLVVPVRWLIDRLYYRDWFNEQEMIKQLGAELSRSLSDKELVRILTVRLPQILKVDEIKLASIEGDTVKYYPSDDAGELSRINLLSDYIHTLIGSSIENYSSRADPELKMLGFEMIYFLKQADETVGVLLIGRKSSGALFSDKDVILLNALSNQAASALANISLTRQLIEQEKRTMAANMAGSIAHEINNSLAPLLGQAQLAEMKLRKSVTCSSDSILPSIDIIISMSDRIHRIANNLNTLSKPSKLEPEWLTLESVAEETLNIIGETAGRIKRYRENDETAPYRIRKQFSDPQISIRGDRQQLGQVFLNLIVNASDALEEQGHGLLTIGIKQLGDEGVVGFIEDDGPGIPLEIQDRIFQPYFSTKSKGKGTGLGLAIVNQIIELHHGTLKLFSQPGSGTRFEFILPINSETEFKQP